jgi:hypothetical protein
MTAKINHKIVGYKVKTDAPEAAPAELEVSKGLHEDVPRPEVIPGATYKIKPANQENAMYITFNNVEIDGKVHPFEMFINSKDMSHYQWVVALTRVVSAVFRKGGDVTFLVDELKSIFDPRGGYFKKGGRYMNSLVAEIGYVLEEHLIAIGLIVPEVDEHMAAFIETKKVEAGNALENAMPCAKCHAKAVVMRDGCATCLECGDSKCG